MRLRLPSTHTFWAATALCLGAIYFAGAATALFLFWSTSK
jgi:hypothetical protein